MPLVVTASEEQGAVQQASQAISATATFAPRTSLQVSSQVLQFHVTDGSSVAEASVEFAAGARTRNGGDVMLVVEAPPLPPGGALTMAAGTEGTIATAVVQDAPTVVARWVGAGLRTGRVTFQLKAAPGRYEIPVRFLLNLN